MLLCLLPSTPRAMEDYVRCLRNTQQHRLYLLANGANHLESLVPGARRALRGALLPLLWQRSSAMPFAMALFFLTLLVCGLSFGAALLLTLLVWLSAIAAAVIAAVLSMWLADRQLFDRNERLRVAEQ
jgi:ABC-type iron transport system FetAB permease component